MQGSEPLSTSAQAIAYIKSALQKKMAITDQYRKYVDDSKKLIEQNTKKMQNVYNSDLNPDDQQKQLS